MRGKGRSLSIEEKLQKMATGNLQQKGFDVFRDKGTRMYYCLECLSEVLFLQDCSNCGKKIDWDKIVTE